MPRPPTSPKADFIRSQPESLSVAEVVQRASEAGLVISDSMVRKTRGSKKPRKRVARGAAGAKSASGTPASSSPSAATARRSSGVPSDVREAERVIVETALRVVGIERAITILEAARDRIDRLLD